MSMTENSRASNVVLLPVVLLGLVCAGIAFYPQPADLLVTLPIPLDEAGIVQRAIEQGLATLPSEAPALGRAERHLLLRLNDSPERRLEVAGGLYAIASKHLQASSSPEAMRVAQICADLAPGSLIAARCWLLSGDASAVAHPDLPLSIRYYERADVALRERLERQPDDTQALRLRADVLQRLAQTKDRFGRTGDAIAHLRELTDNVPLTEAQPPVDRLRAQLSLGLLLHKSGLVGQATRILTVARDMGLSDEVPAAEALHALIVATCQQWPDVSDPSRTAAWRELWDTPRFKRLPEWFSVGDELASAYFFAEPRQGADFEIVLRELLTSLPDVLAALPNGSEQLAGLESLYATNLLLAVDSALNRSDLSEVARLVAIFETHFAGRDIQFTSPLDRPAQRLHHIGEIYRTTMTGHVEQLRQIHATGTAPQ
jgi:hypothetical protein